MHQMTFPPLTGKSLKKYVMEAVAEYQETPNAYKERAGGDKYFIKNHDLVITALAESNALAEKYTNDKAGAEAAAKDRQKSKARREETRRVVSHVVNGGGSSLRSYTSPDDEGEDFTDGVHEGELAEENEARRKACALVGV
jgi:hypothetical protein